MDDAPDWAPLADVLEDLGMTQKQFEVANPGIDLDHRNFDGEIVVDRNAMN